MARWAWATHQPRDPVRSTSGDGDSGTGLSVRAENDGDRWGGIPRVHPLSSCVMQPTSSVGRKLPFVATKSTANRVAMRCHCSLRAIPDYRMRYDRELA